LAYSVPDKSGAAPEPGDPAMGQYRRSDYVPAPLPKDTALERGGPPRSWGTPSMPIDTFRLLKRLLFFSILLALHLVFVFLPIIEIFLLYIVIYKPKWFTDL
jgi:hypothetical protein